MSEGREFVQKAFGFGQRKYYRALGHAAALPPDGTVGGMCGLMARLPFTPEHILLGYAQGLFPMERRGKIDWHCPDPRSVVPLDRLHMPKRVRQYLRSGLFQLRFDTDPKGVLQACGDRRQTWLTPRVQTAYQQLFDMEAMHTVEAWKDGELVGGAFGVAVGKVFTVESVFSRENHAGKLAFAHLCQYLAQRDFELVDCQYQRPHFERFGAIEISREEYRQRLARGLIHPATFDGSATGTRGAGGSRA